MKNEKWGNLDNDGRHTKKISAASFSDKNKTKQEKRTSVTRIRPKSLLGYFSKPNEFFFHQSRSKEQLWATSSFLEVFLTINAIFLALI